MGIKETSRQSGFLPFKEQLTATGVLDGADGAAVLLEFTLKGEELVIRY